MRRKPLAGIVFMSGEGSVFRLRQVCFFFLKLFPLSFFPISHPEHSRGIFLFARHPELLTVIPVHAGIQLSVFRLRLGCSSFFPICHPELLSVIPVHVGIQFLVLRLRRGCLRFFPFLSSRAQPRDHSLNGPPAAGINFF